MTDDILRHIAANAGAALNETARPSELISFELCDDGTMRLGLASGEVHTVASIVEVPPENQREHQVLTQDMLLLVERLLGDGLRLRRGVVYTRRTAGGREVFLEAGR